MKKYHAVILFVAAGLLAPELRAQAPAADSCIVSGYVYMGNLRPAANKLLTVKKVVKSGVVVAVGDSVYKTDGTGFVRLRLWRNSTAYIYAPDVPALASNSTAGTAVTIPDAATAAIESIVPAASVPTSYVVACAGLYAGKTTKYPTDTLVLTGTGVTAVVNSFRTTTATITGGGSGTYDTSQTSEMLDAGAVRPTTFANAVAGKAGADSVAQQIALVKNMIAADADADSIHIELVALYNLVTGKAGADSVNTQLVALNNAVAGKSDADSVILAHNKIGALADADSVHTVLNTIYNVLAGKAGADSLSLQIALVKNILGGKGDSDSLAAASDTAKSANKNAATALGKIDAHALLTNNPHSVTAAQAGALALADTSALHAQKLKVLENGIAGKAGADSVSTALSARVLIADSTVRYATPSQMYGRISDTASARALAVGDSLLAMRGFVRSAIADTLDLFSRGWMAGDTAVVGPDLDAMYARSGGGAAVDTSLLVGNDRDDLSIQGDKWFKGHVMLTKQLWIYDSTHAQYRNMLQYDNYVLDIGINAANYIYFWSNNSKVIAFSAGGAETQNDMYIWAKGNSRIAIGTTTQPTTSNMKPLYVVGGAQITDTTRFGDWTTYTYIIPGGDLVKSSTRDIKTDISAIETPKDFEARILSVSPKRYRFKPEAYMRGVSDTLKGEDLTKALAEDAAQAAKQSERVVTGFIAEEFNPAFGIDPASKEIHTSDIIAAQWKAIQMLTARVKALEARLTKLEGAR